MYNLTFLLKLDFITVANVVKHLFYNTFFLLLLSLHCSGQLAVKQILVNGKTIVYGKDSTIHLSVINEDLVIELQPIKIDSVKYFYRLLGFQDSWFWTTYPSVHYQQLAGGKYTLQMKAESDIYKSKILEIPINIKETFWQKWWFWPSIVLYMILILGVGLYLFFLYNFRQKLKLLHIRNQIASDLHDEVGSNLNSIAIFVELLRKKMSSEQSDFLPILNKITSNSEETVSLMRDTVWAINPVNDSTEKLLEKMRSFGVELLSAKGVSFDFEQAISSKKEVFSMEQRRNLYFIYKEAINNIAKHADATKAFCQIINQQGAIHIYVSDNGKGFDLNKTFEGNGLKNFKFRSQDEDLKVSVQSKPGKGTEIHIEIIL